ncbi:GNAT family N-acetyltransferase [Xylanimonas protaetiae]|uniref:GNAT family N-acetyltransferase n=1 Tax=Xylanimonas protaetiae TaxID=2509457 RepID=A0A4P6F749_9MICO|nr:GNAT family N-acetyltransferase [Xylanimonas protaetiae]
MRLARVLGAADLPAALAVCAQDPVAAVLASSRLEIAAVAGLAAAGGQVWGWPAVGPLQAVCWAGANLVPVVPASLGDDAAEAVEAFARTARGQGRRSSSIVGESGAALALWASLERHWPRAREIRAHQPSLAIARDPDVEPDPRVRLSRPEELNIVLPACVAMFTEEVGYSPVAGGGTAYRERVRSLVAEGRSYVRLAAGTPGDPYRRVSPLVEFKAELGAVAQGVAQVQGVWVDPAVRGTGLSEGGMAAVVADARRRVAPVVSLYVNGFNVRALRAYRRVGFEQVGTFATVLF